MNRHIELTSEKFAEIYTNESFRNNVAFAHRCCDGRGNFKYYGTCSWPQRYRVTPQQITEARKEYERAKAGVYEKYSSDLLFAGMGMPYVPRFEGDAGNHRIRTTFKNSDGHSYFIECCRNMDGDNFYVDTTVDIDRQKELNNAHHRQSEYYDIAGIERKPLGLKYTGDNLLRLVNRYFNCRFKNVVIDNYNIHPDDREIICESPKL
jgi:hypothetical protein